MRAGVVALLKLAVPSLLLAAALDQMNLPASWLLGPMVVAITLTARGMRFRMPRPAFLAAQGVIGCLIARTIPGDFFGTLQNNALVLVAGVVSVSALAALLGWFLARWSVFPADTAIWGSAPGAATAMLVMAEAHGADVRLVAFMQYLRVVAVTVTTSLVAHVWTGAASHPSHQAGAASILLPAESWTSLAITLAIALGGASLGVRLRVPAGALLVPLVIGIVVQGLVRQPLELPPIVLMGTYIVVGWAVGTQFDRHVLLACLASLPVLLASTFALIVLCAGVAALLVCWTGMDPLTAYLATSPGGADVIAIIATSSPVDAAFIVTMQVFRMLFVMITGPAIARALSRRLRQHSP